MVTRSVLHVGPGGPGVPPHTHDGSEIEGTADLIHLRVDQLLAGTITGKEVILAGGAAGVIRSDNFASGVDGWAIFGDGSAEFNDVVVRGTIVAGSGSEVDWSYIKNVSIENADIVSLSFDKITAATNTASLVIGASGSISTSNYVAGTSGVLISESLTEFNDVVVRGDLVSGNWDGADPLDLSSVDTTATAGVAIDSSAGAMQLMGDMFVGGNVTLISGGVFRTASGTERLEITGSEAQSIRFYDNDLTVGMVGWSVDDSVFRVRAEFHDLRLQTDGSGDVWLQPWTEAFPDDWGQVVLGVSGTAAKPGLSFFDGDTTYHDGVYYDASNDLLGLTIGGTAVATFGSGGVHVVPSGTAAAPSVRVGEATTGLYRNSTGQLGLAAGGAAVMILDDNNGPHITTHQTTASAANTVINTDTTPFGRLQRSTSALKYKRRVTTNVDYLADLELVPTKHWRVDDKAWKYGLIADWLVDQDPLLGEYGPDGEVENYDLRAVITVLVAKVNRLEAAVAALKGAA